VRFNFKGFVIILVFFFAAFELFHYLTGDELIKKSLAEHILYTAFIAAIFTIFFFNKKKKKEPSE
jgi:hypothetical protein